MRLITVNTQRVLPKSAPDLQSRSVRTVLAEPYVEPELFGEVPRRVVDTRGTRQWRIWLTNICAGLMLTAYYLNNTPECLPHRGFVPLCILLAGFTGVVWSIGESVTQRSRTFLREGYAARATVDECVPPLGEGAYYELHYYYTYSDQSRMTGYLKISTDEARRLGEFEVGTTFTVLLNASEKFVEPLPYFQISGVEIPGAAPIRVLPPTVSNSTEP